MSESESIWTGAARVVGVFAVLGFALGGGALLGLWSVGFFEGSDAGFGAGLGGAFILMGTYAFAVVVGPVVATLGAHFLSLVLPSKGEAVASAAVAGALGHVLLLTALTVTLAVGFSALGGAGDGEGSDDGLTSSGIPDLSTLAQLFGSLLPSAVVGAATAALLWVEPGERQAEFAVLDR